MAKVPTGFFTAPPMPYAAHMFGGKFFRVLNPVEDMQALQAQIGPLAHMAQDHGDRILHADNAGLYKDCDALMTNQPGLWLGVKTADCLPILISSPKAVAAVHCGWRGLASKLLPKTIKLMLAEYHLNDLDLHITIGPHISTEHYEVGQDLTAHFPAHVFHTTTDGRFVLDLASVAYQQAIECGVSALNIVHVNRCTFAEEDSFNSYRRSMQNTNEDSRTRNIALVMLEKAEN